MLHKNVAFLSVAITLMTTAAAAAGPTIDDIRNAWLINIDPNRPFRSPQGTIPTGVSGKSGRPNRAAAHVETVSDDNVKQFPLDSTTLTAFTSNTTLNWGSSRAPDFLYSTPAHPVTFNSLERVPDPEKAGQWLYQHRINRFNFASYYLGDSVPAPDAIRSELTPVGEDRFETWGTEEMAVFAIRLPAGWKSIQAGGEWAIHFQWHDAEGGLTHNPPFALMWTGGGTDPSRAKWTARLKRYAYTPAEYAANPTRTKNVTVKTETIRNPAADTWHYFVAHYRSGPGAYRDPMEGLIYGPTDPNRVFFRLYHAQSNGSLSTVMNYTGFWGSPHSPSSANKRKAGYWKTGIYMNSNWASGGPDRTAFTKGMMVWRMKDVMGMTPQQALQAFKQERSF